MEWLKKSWPFVLVAFIVALIRSFVFDKISNDACLNVKNIPADLSRRQQKEFCHCERRTGDYYITHAAIKRMRAGEGRPEDDERYNRFLKPVVKRMHEKYRNIFGSHVDAHEAQITDDVPQTRQT